MIHTLAHELTPTTRSHFSATTGVAVYGNKQARRKTARFPLEYYFYAWLGSEVVSVGIHARNMHKFLCVLVCHAEKVKVWP